jgi:serine/threonine protein kinase
VYLYDTGLIFCPSQDAKIAIKQFVTAPDVEGSQKDIDIVWEKEVGTYDTISKFSHPNIVQYIGKITRGPQRFLLFPWADGGNLWDFWKRNSKVKMTGDWVRSIVRQLRGIADAIKKMHAIGDNEPNHHRHGDLKPENILHFPDSDETRLGTFKITDMGSTKFHALATGLRDRSSDKAFATIMYQPPESVTNSLAPSSRLYDIWSMGCVTLEFIVWILYGYEELKRFSTNIKGGMLSSSSSFFVTEQLQHGIHVARVHPVVQGCLNHMSKDPECSGSTALGDLLDIVRKRLLVIDLPPPTEGSDSKSAPQSTKVPNLTVINTEDDTERYQTSGNKRANAGEFVDALDKILRCENENYWFTGKSRENINPPIYTPQIASNNGSLRLSPGLNRQTGQMVDRSPALQFAPDVSVSQLLVPSQDPDVRTHK